MGGPGGISGIPEQGNISLGAMLATGADTAQELKGEQKVADASAQAANALTAQPLKAPKTKKPLKARKPSRVEKKLEKGEKQEVKLKKFEDSANKFQQRNPELKAETLKALRANIFPGDTKEEILAKVKAIYSDVSLVDEAFEFLLETTEGELFNKIKEAKEDFSEEHNREITAGRNMGGIARKAAEVGLGTPTSLRDLYRDITGNPRDANTLFTELSDKYPFKQLNKVTKFLLHSLGSDITAKGPSIEPAHLHRLIAETRTIQAILGVFLFFKGRMHLVETEFKRNDVELPKALNFESMSKEFMKFVADRYPNINKLYASAKNLDISDSTSAEIIAFNQFRDAVRQVAPNLIFRSIQHRDQVLEVIIEVLEKLEETLEEELNEEDGT
jgi:type III secretion protein W